MAGPSKSTKYNLPFKKIRGKANTSNDTPVFSEDISSQVSIDVGEVLGQKIPEDPQKAVDNGVAEYVRLELDEIVSTNGLSFNLTFPSDYNGSFGTGVQRDNVRVHTQIVKKAKNPNSKARPDHSGGYVYDLKDGTGKTIYSGAKEDWILDPVAGIITSESPIFELTENGGTVGAYIYTGGTLDDVLAGASVNIEEDGTPIQSSASTLNFSDGFTLESEAGGTVKITASFEGATTDQLDEGTENLYYTDTRVDDRVNTIRPSDQATFSGNGVQKTFQIQHTLPSKPDSWIVTPVTDDGSSFSHVTADDNVLNVVYDTPPPSGTDNIVLNWLVTTF
jgi:hypothetical protein